MLLLHMNFENQVIVCKILDMVQVLVVEVHPPAHRVKHALVPNVHTTVVA
jgi:hypothetical protein